MPGAPLTVTVSSHNLLRHSQKWKAAWFDDIGLIIYLFCPDRSGTYSKQNPRLLLLKAGMVGMARFLSLFLPKTFMPPFLPLHKTWNVVQKNVQNSSAMNKTSVIHRPVDKSDDLTQCITVED